MRLLLPALFAGSLAAPAAAQPPQPAASLPYRSALEGYQRHADQDVAPWPATNATVGRIGGWRAYAREAAGSAPGDSPLPDEAEGHNHGRARGHGGAGGHDPRHGHRYGGGHGPGPGHDQSSSHGHGNHHGHHGPHGGGHGSDGTHGAHGTETQPHPPATPGHPPPAGARP